MVTHLAIWYLYRRPHLADTHNGFSKTIAPYFSMVTPTRAAYQCRLLGA